MLTSRKTFITAAVAGAAVLAPAAAHAAPTTLAVEKAPTRVAAWDGTVMWSTFDPATKTYSLVKSVDGGAPVAVGVAPRSGKPFDIDLGTGPSGETFAVYTRGGDVYRLNVATQSETKMKRISSPKHVERDPTIQRGAIAFIRRSGGLDHLRIVDTNTGPQGKLILQRRSIPSAELGERHIAYVESRPRGAGGVATVHVRNLRTGADRSVYRAVSGGSNFANVTKPTYSVEPQGFMWARTNLGSGEGNRLVRYTLADRELAHAPGSQRYNTAAWVNAALGAVTSGSLDGSETQGACTDTPAQYCTVALSGPLPFG
jgi:hypothetical protein